MRTILEEVRFTEATTEVRERERSSRDPGGAADGRSNAPMDMAMAMEMVTAVTSIPTETAGEDKFELMARIENGKRRRKCEVPAAAWAVMDWRSPREHAAQQQAHGQAQLHRTVTERANMLKTHTAQHDVQ
jgi:hypothetical protein